MSQEPNGEPICNVTLNNEEYYDPNPLKNAGNAIGGMFSLPFILSSLIFSIIFIICFGIFWAIQYNKNGWDVITIILLTIVICCMVMCVTNIVQFFKAKRAISNSITSGQRPCFSQKQNKLIIN